MVRILVVEDEIIVAQDIQRMLENLGYAVVGIAVSGRDAIKLSIDNQPDLVLMDVRLKGEIDGIEAAKKIHKRINTPIIYLSAYADNKTVERAKITEPFGYLVKPFTEKELHSAIETALYKYEMHSKLLEKEAFNYALFEYNPIETIVVDRKAKIINYNLAKKKSGDRLPEIGDVMYKDYAAKHKNNMYSELLKCIKSGKIKEFPNQEYRNKIFNITISPFSKGAIITSQDITEKKKFENQIVEEVNRWQATFDSITDPILVINMNYEIVRANRTLMSRLNMSYSEIIGQLCYKIMHRYGRLPDNCFLNGSWKNRPKRAINKNFKFPGIFDCSYFPLETNCQKLGIIYMRDVTKEYEASYKLRELSWRIMITQEEERRRIAQELHDELSQTLTSLKLDASWLQMKLSNCQPEINNRLDSIIERVDNLIKEINQICYELRPNVIENTPLYSLVKKISEDFTILSGIDCKVNVSIDDKNINEEVKTCAYRIISEALTNVLRHSYATEVITNIREKNGNLLVFISDNGIGISNSDLESTRSLGLIGMKERVHSIRGTLKIIRGPVSGTVIEAFLPLR